MKMLVVYLVVHYALGSGQLTRRYAIRRAQEVERVVGAGRIDYRAGIVHGLCTGRIQCKDLERSLFPVGIFHLAHSPTRNRKDAGRDQKVRRYLEQFGKRLEVESVQVLAGWIRLGIGFLPAGGGSPRRTRAAASILYFHGENITDVSPMQRRRSQGTMFVQRSAGTKRDRCPTLVVATM